MSKGARVTVRAQVVVEVPVGVWGGEATFASQLPQWTREAQQIVENALQKNGGRVVSVAKVSATVSTEEP